MCACTLIEPLRVYVAVCVDLCAPGLFIPPLLAPLLSVLFSHFCPILSIVVAVKKSTGQGKTTQFIEIRNRVCTNWGRENEWTVFSTALSQFILPFVTNFVIWFFDILHPHLLLSIDSAFSDTTANYLPTFNNHGVIGLIFHFRIYSTWHIEVATRKWFISNFFFFTFFLQSSRLWCAYLLHVATYCYVWYSHCWCCLSLYSVLVAYFDFSVILSSLPMLTVVAG